MFILLQTQKTNPFFLFTSSKEKLFVGMVSENDTFLPLIFFSQIMM